MPDLHFPFEDKRKVAYLLDWIKKNRPDRVVLLGDVLELHALSTHRKDPRWEDRLKEEVASGKRFLQRLRQAAPKAEITYIVGNHTRRWYIYFQNRAPAMRLLGIDIRDLLGVSELGIKWHDNDRKGVKVPIGQGRVAYCYHGDQFGSSKTPGGSAFAAASKLGHNVIMGHTHKLGLIASPVMGKDLFGIEAGCLVNMKHRVFDYGGLRPMWSHAFLVCDSEQTESPYPKIIRP